jgi:hypothetical protein
MSSLSSTVLLDVSIVEPEILTQQIVTVGCHNLLTNGTSADMPSRVINVASMAGIQTTDVTTGEEGGLSAPGHGTFSCKKASCSDPLLFQYGVRSAICSHTAVSSGKNYADRSNLL